MMTPSRKCIDLVKESEGCKLKAYWDEHGKCWTIGYGHTRGCCEGLTCTQSQAEAWIADDLRDAAQIVRNVVTAPLNQNQFDALVSFVYNVGPGSKTKQGFVRLPPTGRHSTMLKLLNGGDYNGAAKQFPLWNKAGGVVLDGLTKRRKKEQALFNTPVLKDNP